MKLIFALLFSAGCAGASQELDLSGPPGPFDPARNVRVVLHDQVGTGFRLVSATYLLDGKQIFFRSDSNGWTELPEDLRVFETYAAPGWHQLIVLLEYRPNDLGIFTYARGYRMKIKSGTNFAAHSHQPTAVHAVIKAQGGLTSNTEAEVAYHVLPETPRGG